jgi:hypothetical protein
MAFDAKLAARVRAVLSRLPPLTEKEMFGGVGFLVGGNMAVGVMGSDLLVRVGPAGHADAVRQPHVRPFALTGRPSKGWVLVAPDGVKSAAGLKTWVERGLSFARALPPK